MFKLLSPVFVFFLTLSGCDVSQVAKETKSAVEQSNHTSQEILDQIKKTNELTEQVKSSLKQVADATHLQILTTAFQGMLAPENTQSLVPPARMLPFAETLAREATHEELIKIAHVLYSDARFSPIENAKTRMVSLVALSALGGFAPEVTLDQILKNEIEDPGVYEETAYALLIGRYAFIRDFLFSPLLIAPTNVKKLFEVVKYFKQLRIIATLSYLEKLSLNIPDLDVQVQVEKAELWVLAKKARNFFLGLLSEWLLTQPEVQKALDELTSGRNNRAELVPVGSPQSVLSASGVEVPVHREARAHFPGAPTEGYPLYLTGAGVLVKKFGFINVNVYIMTSYTDRSSGVSPLDPMSDLKIAKVKAVKLHLVRSVSAQEIRSEFMDCLEVNGIDVNSPGFKDLLQKISFSIGSGDTVTFIGEAGLQPNSPNTMLNTMPSTMNETLYVNTSMGHSFEVADDDLSYHFWKIWFGTPLNQGYATLKKKLLGG